MRRTTPLLVLASVLMLGATPDIRSTKHNLSASSPNTIKSDAPATGGTTEVCVFCHTPHKAVQTKPLWNRDLSYQDTLNYIPYGSTTLNANVPRPNGASKLCLSCHDGTVGLGSLMNLNAGPANVKMLGTDAQGRMPTTSAAHLGSDLRNDHPISMILDAAVVAADGDLRVPNDPAVRLREEQRVQCTTCHDPHLSSYKFLVKDNTGGDQLCVTCHPKAGWVGSMHESSRALYPATGSAQTEVGNLGCMGCHKPHNALSPSRLLAPRDGRAWTEENVCFSCHKAGGTTTDPSTGRAAPNLETEFTTKGVSSGSAHPIGNPATLNQHQPVFFSTASGEKVQNDSKHVECADCHNPHQVRPVASGDQSSVHRGMKGISMSGAEVADTAGNIQQHEVCLRCHGETFATFIPPRLDARGNQVRTTTGTPASANTSGSNKRLEFQGTNRINGTQVRAAYHPVGQPGLNTSNHLNNYDAGGQLKGVDWQGRPLDKFSTLLCTDCHNNNATAVPTDAASRARAGSVRNPLNTAGPRGPHASTNTRLLRAPYSTARGNGDASTRSQLCLQCHDLGRLTGSGSNFHDQGSVGKGRGNLHNVHLIDRTNASCAECHYNIHSNVEAANTEYLNLDTNESTHLINFAPTVTGNGGNAKPQWGRLSAGNTTYFCRLSCHGETGAMDGTESRYRPSSP